MSRRFMSTCFILGLISFSLLSCIITDFCGGANSNSRAACFRQPSEMLRSADRLEGVIGRVVNMCIQGRGIWDGRRMLLCSGHRVLASNAIRYSAE